MSRRKSILFAVVLLALMAGFVMWFFWLDASGTSPATRLASSHPNDPVWRAETRRLRAADPGLDADHALQQGDFRILGLWGDGDYYPGVAWQSDRYDWQKLFALCGTRMFEDTSDAIESDTQWRYIHVAEQYAEAYNARLIDGLERLGKLPAPQPSTNGSPTDATDPGPDPAP